MVGELNIRARRMIEAMPAFVITPDGPEAFQNPEYAAGIRYAHTLGKPLYLIIEAGMEPPTWLTGMGIDQTFEHDGSRESFAQALDELRTYIERTTGRTVPFGVEYRVKDPSGE